MKTVAQSLRDILQNARKSRHISQLELGLRIGVSQRHVSFVESGRARPSRELLMTWLNELQVPLAVHNVALLQAGYAPLYRESQLSDVALSPAREALSQLLAAHDPMPAMVMDASWNVIQMNRGAQWLARTLMPWISQWPQDQALNMLDAMLHPEGMTRQMINIEEVAPAMLAHLRDHAMVVPELLPRVELLTVQLEQRVGKKWVQHSFKRQPRQIPPVLTTRFSTEYGELAFFSMFTTFGTPQDITLASLRVEHMFAADTSTRAVVVAHVT